MKKTLAPLAFALILALSCLAHLQLSLLLVDPQSALVVDETTGETLAISGFSI
jgi:hypothetical protein